MDKTFHGHILYLELYLLFCLNVQFINIDLVVFLASEILEPFAVII